MALLVTVLLFLALTSLINLSSWFLGETTTNILYMGDNELRKSTVEEEEPSAVPEQEPEISSPPPPTAEVHVAPPVDESPDKLDFDSLDFELDFDENALEESLSGPMSGNRYCSDDDFDATRVADELIQDLEVKNWND